MWTPTDNVLLGNSALEQLGMLPITMEREQESLFAWLSKASTAMGRRAIRERLLKPIADIDELERRQTIIAELRANPAEREALEKTIRGAYDLSRLHRRFQLGNGTTDDLLQLYGTYEKAAALVKMTEGKLYGVEDAPALQTFLDSVLLRFDADRTRQARAQVSDAVAVGSVHPWRRGVFAELDAFEAEWTALEKTVRGYIDAMEEVLDESDAITLTLKDEAPFTLTTTSRRGNVLVSLGKKRLRMDVSIQKRGGSASQVQLDSPEIAAANAAGAALRSRWIAAVAETWRREWLAWVKMGIESGLLETLVEWMGALDCECTLARLSDLYGYVRPAYKEPASEKDAGFYVCELRHPIIERIHTGTPYIPHSLAYGVFSSAAVASAGADAVATTEAGILLYGVNAAGKSSLGKAIGLAVLMAQTGMPVPATQMDLIPYTGIFTRILGNDNLWAGMSSFVVEMTEFRSILRGAGPRTLVISDELCAGTETASATSIVAAGFSVLANRGAHFFSATHLHELAAFPEIAAHPRIRSYHLTVHAAANGTLVYDRKLREGTGSPMYGLEVCRGLDMDPEFLTLAFDFRKKYAGAADSEGKPSRYNAGVVVSRCEVCGGAADLETHHIVPQAAADARGYIRPGTHKHAKENLVVLCESCHTKHHGGLLEIEGWAATSAGRVLRVATATAT
jgi:DNA mismatch repair protein MutS